MNPNKSLLALLSFALIAIHARAQFFQGFEVDNSGWNVFGGQNDATRVASGTHGVTSRTGNWHAEAPGPFSLASGGSAITRWGGYGGIPACGGSMCAAPFPAHGYFTSVDIYLDVSAANPNDTRFDFDSAINQPDGSFRRDFVFNTGFYNVTDATGSVPRFVTTASNNAGRGNVDPENPARLPFAITTSGWYTFQHHFYDNGSGTLAADLSILDSSGALLNKWTLSDPSDVIGTTVGGNRYGWFASNEFSFLAFDNSSRTAPTGFVTGFNLNGRPLRSDFTGLVGMKFTVGSSALNISAIGRVCVAGNSQTHAVKLVLASTAVDVPGGTASVNMTGCTGGQFVYTSLASPITLPAGSSYYLASQETVGGDQWYDFGTVSTTGDGSVTSSIYFDGASWIPVNGPNSSYVPPNFLYTTAPPDPTPAFVTSFNLNNRPLRSNFSGFVGMRLTVGANALTVPFIGRVCVAGNSQTHTVKFVVASTGADVPGASAQVNMAGCAAGQFVYASPAGAVTLLANTTYYLASQENNGGDQWYDHGTLATTNAAAVNSSVWFDGLSWNPIDAANTSYVPPNFKYQSVAPGPISVSVGTNPPGLSFTVDSITYTSNQAFSWTSGSPHSISTTTPQNVGSGSQQAFSSWSDGGAISHSVSPTSPMTFSANFALQYLLTSNVAPVNSGNIAANPASASGYYNSGTLVQLTATPNTGFGFVNWTGDLSDSVNPENITMSAPHSVTANFQAVAGGPSNFVTGFALNSPPTRNNFGGFVGMKLTVGANPLDIASVGRVCIPGNGGNHSVKFVRASSGVDVPNGSATINMAGCAGGQFVYAKVAIVLQANTAYYLVSQESSGGDAWYDFGTVTTRADAAVNSSIYFDGANWIPVGPANSAYVPPDFKYTVLPPDSTTAFVTDFNLNHRPVRSDFTGLVGTKFTVGATGLIADSIGRVCVTGNSGTHLVEFVNASNSQVVGSASVSLAGCTPGLFVYATLSNPVTLQAGATYYLASQETSGGDQWYDHGTIATTNAATVNSSIWFDGAHWNTIDAENTSYVPPNFKYALQGAPIIEVFASPAPNVFGSPSWAPYLTNAIHALQNGLTAVGTPSTDPTAYFRVSQENEEQNIVSGFPSWLGFVNPGTMFGAAFTNELGNRLHFGLHILGNGTKFSLSGLFFDMESTDAGDIFQFIGDFTSPSDAYSSTRVGLNYGPDGIKGTGDDVLISSGPATQQVDELFYVGVGNAIAPSDVGCAGSTQSTLDCGATYYKSIMPFNLSTVYTIEDSLNHVLSQGSAVVPFIASQVNNASLSVTSVQTAGPSQPHGQPAK